MMLFGMSNIQAAVYDTSYVCSGTAVLLKEKAAYQIRDEVTTPGGTTAAALGAMEKAGFVAAVYEGVEAAAERARRLARSRRPGWMAAG